MNNSRALPDWLDGFMQFTENTEPPDRYRRWVGISTIAAVLQRKCFVRMGMETFYPNLYIVLVGPPACRKGTAMKPGFLLLDRLGISLIADNITREALVKRMGSINHTSIDPLTGKPIMHASVSIWSPEFAVFLGFRNQEFMSVLCDWYDCAKRWKYETKNSGSDEIIGVWVNLLGATTPKLLHTMMPSEAISGGLTSRIVFVHEFAKGKTVIFPVHSDPELNLFEDLANDLEKIHLLQGEFRYTEGWISLYSDWYRKSDSSPPILGDVRFDDYLGRRQVQLIKLSQVLCASRSDSMILTQEDLSRAIAILDDVEKNMGTVFSGMGKSDLAELIPQVLGWLRTRGTSSLRDLMKNFYHDADVQTMERVLRSLKIQGAVRMDHKQSGIDVTYILGEEKGGQG